MDEDQWLEEQRVEQWRRERDRALKFLTEEEYSSLRPQEEWLMNWMARWRPLECERLKANGTLLQWLEEQEDWIIRMEEEGYRTNNLGGARELIADRYLTNPEPDADRYWGLEEEDTED